MNQLTLFIIAVFAVWRDAVAVTEEEGPFGSLSYIRDHIDPNQTTWLGRGIRCQWCVSVWCALAVILWLCYFEYVPWSLFPIWWFGLSGGSVTLSNVTERLFTRRR